MVWRLRVLKRRDRNRKTRTRWPQDKKKKAFADGKTGRVSGTSMKVSQGGEGRREQLRCKKGESLGRDNCVVQGFPTASKRERGGRNPTHEGITEDRENIESRQVEGKNEIQLTSEGITRIGHTRKWGTAGTRSKIQGNKSGERRRNTNERKRFCIGRGKP